MRLHRPLSSLALFTLSSLVSACGGDGPASTAGVVLRSEVTPVTRAEDALTGVFIPPFEDCRAPRPGDTTADPRGLVCTNVSIAGATEPGKSFADYGSCEVVLTQRPYWPAPPAKAPTPDDPRLQDPALMAEVAWARDQLRSTGCACCHDSKVAPDGRASQWDISAEGVWLDTLSNTGLALFTGLADSAVLGAYPAARNHGFDRTQTGVPTTDTARMRALTMAELARRGMAESDARGVPPFGGPIYQNSVRPAGACGAGEGVDPQGRVWWSFGQARYVYVLAEGSKNPGVPPNLDRPEGTLWRLDVLANAVALEPGIAYGKTPPGSFQDLPADAVAPPLQPGRTYQLTVLADVGFPVANCLFQFGTPVARD